MRLLRLLLCVATVVLLQATLSLSCPSDLDPTFHGTGVSLNPIGTEEVTLTTDLAVVPTGGAVAAGILIHQDDWLPIIVRFNDDGSIDQTFGFGGVAILNLTGGIRTIAVDKNGRILVGGDQVRDGKRSFFVARLEPSGDPDESFGIEGITITAIDNRSSYVNDVAALPDDRIIAVGVALAPTPDDDAEAVLACYRDNGSLDTSFGTQGMANGAPRLGSAGATGLLLRTDNTFIVTGYLDKRREMFLSKFDFRGSSVTDFGTNGVRMTRSARGERPGSICEDAQHRIIVGIAVWNELTEHSKAFVRRFLPSGSNDLGFGKRGRSRPVRLPGAVVAHAVVVDQSETVSVAVDPRQRGVTPVLARYLSDGSPDDAFRRSAGSFFRSIAARSLPGLVLQADQKLLMAGYADGHIFVARVAGGSDTNQSCGDTESN